MASLKMRYGGNVIELAEGFNYNPENYGTARLNYRIASNSVGKLGLTTNTNAKAYCKLAMRVNGQICFIGRVSSTNYISGDTIDYNGSVVGSRISEMSSSSESFQSSASYDYPVITSSMSISTSQYTQTTGTRQIVTNSYTQAIETNSYTYQARTSVASRTVSEGVGVDEQWNTSIPIGTDESGNYYRKSYTYTSKTASETAQIFVSTNSINVNNGYQYCTSNANPGTGEAWNGNSYINKTRTASEQIVNNSATSILATHASYYTSSSRYTNGFAGLAGTSKIFTFTTKVAYYTYVNRLTVANMAALGSKSKQSNYYGYGNGYQTLKVNISTGNSSNTGGTRVTYGKAHNDYATYSTSSFAVSSQMTYKWKSSAGAMTKTTYTFESTGMTADALGLSTHTYYTYTTRWTAWASSYYRQSYYSTRSIYSGSWSSWVTYLDEYYATYTQREYSTRTIEEYGTETLIGTTYYSSITRSTTSVSETIHNMNV